MSNFFLRMSNMCLATMEFTALGTDNLIQNIRLLEEECFQQPWSFKSISSALEHDNFWIVIDGQGEIQDSFMGITEIQRRPLRAYVMGRYTPADSLIELLRLGVALKFRRQGLAHRLLAHLEGRVCEYLGKAQRITIELRKKNHAAQALYKKYGYAVMAQRPAYYFDRDDALVMEKTLSLEADIK